MMCAVSATLQRWKALLIATHALTRDFPAYKTSERLPDFGMVKYRQPFDEKLTKVILVIKTDGGLYIQRKNNTRAKMRLVLFFLL